MVRCKLPGAEWSGNILACHIRGKMRGEKLFRQLLFFHYRENVNFQIIMRLK